MRFLAPVTSAVVLVAIAAGALAADGNRLAYLDASDPFYPARQFPKLVTPQWVGEAGVEAVVILSIDDMRGHERWEAFLRPILERLKKIDGRAPVSIMTCQIDPRHPHLQKWLAEGLSFETHTLDHPCPLLQKGDFAAARRTYEQCVDQMAAVPGSRPVAFRMPCCDSQNTPSPRFYAEIFNRRTPSGNFLQIDSSVFNIITANDPELPRELVVDGRSQEIFRRYLPFESYVVTIEDYPYPYVIGKLCWEFPCVVPSDWSAQHVQKPDNPRTVEDLKRAIDAAVVKQGTFTLVFHPHKWIKTEQIIELVDYAVERYGPKVKFLNFREAAQRLNKNLLAGTPLRGTTGADGGVRLLDANADGYMDVVIGNQSTRRMRLWSPQERKWTESEFPLPLVSQGPTGKTVDAGVRFGVVHADGSPSVFAGVERAWHFTGGKWVEDASLTSGIDFAGTPRGMRLLDVDGDGTCELILCHAKGQAIYGRDSADGWRRAALRAARRDDAGRRPGHRLAIRRRRSRRTAGRDFVEREGLRGVLVRFPGRGMVRGARLRPARRSAGDSDDRPRRRKSGAWFHSRTLWVQNEDTDRMPDLVDRMPLDNLLSGVLFPGPKSPEQSLAVTRARPGFQVELMAAEPLVVDPISIAWGPDGKLWVTEMGDYPRGVDGHGGHGGRVRFLEDTDGDGRLDRSTVFLEGLGFPNGIAPWPRA